METGTKPIKFFESILRDFEELPEKTKSLSVFDVAGYPHYENVASNILAFYLNPNNEHGLGDLLLNSLLEVIDLNLSEYSSIIVNREVSTDNGGRLDIVIESDKQIIGIENKIFHWLANDLKDYSNTIDNMAKPGNKGVVKIVLSVKRESPQCNFQCITYDEFISKIKENLGKYVNTSSQKWLLYLLDFVQTINNIKGEDMSFDEIDKFFIHNNDRIEKLLKARNNFLTKLNQKTVKLFEIVQEPPECKKKWIYAKNCLVIDLVLSGYNIAYDFVIGPKNCQLQLFGRTKKDQNYLQEIIFKNQDDKSIFTKVVDNRFILEEYDLFTNIEDLKKSLETHIDKIINIEKYYKKHQADSERK